tara:strand:- start:272 stop:700 length:429 start_codon:yes stop_codon:yes gene_type:complete
MKKLTLIIIVLIGVISCVGNKLKNERALFIQKLEAFNFLSKYHHQLHIMIGEDEGDGNQALEQFRQGIISINNFELIPIKKALNKIDYYNGQESENVLKLDYLVDYYQSGLSMQIEAMLRGYGYLNVVPMDSALILYDRVSN